MFFIGNLRIFLHKTSKFDKFFSCIETNNLNTNFDVEGYLRYLFRYHIFIIVTHDYSFSCNLLFIRIVWFDDVGFIWFIVLLGLLYQYWQFCLPCNWWQQLTRRTNKFYSPKYNHQLNKDLIINYAPMFSALHYSDNNKLEILTWIPCDLVEIETLMIINEISSYRWVHTKKNARSSLISKTSHYEIFPCLGTFNAFRRKWMEIGN